METPVTKSRKIHLAHADDTSRETLETMLRSLQHQVLLSTASACELIERSVQGSADVIIASPDLQEMDGIDALIRIGQQHPTPAIVVSRGNDLEQIERAMEDHVMAYLVEPISEELLLPSIFLAEQRFQSIEHMRARIKSLESELETRKIVERAKGVVMESRQMNEPDAHRYLQELARRHRTKLGEIALKILTDSAPLNPVIE